MASSPEGSNSSNTSGRRGGKSYKKMLRHFQSIKQARLGADLDTVAEPEGYITKSDEEKDLIFEGIKDNILFNNCSKWVNRAKQPPPPPPPPPALPPGARVRPLGHTQVNPSWRSHQYRSAFHPMHLRLLRSDVD